MKINPENEYSLLEIVELGVMGKSHHSVSAAIWRDYNGDNILKTIVINMAPNNLGMRKGWRYRIKGANLQKYLRYNKDAALVPHTTPIK